EIAHLVVRGDIGDDRSNAAFAQLVGGKGDTSDIEDAVRPGVAEVVFEEAAHLVAVEQFDRLSQPREFRLQIGGQRGLPGTGDSGKPDDGRFVVAGHGHGFPVSLEWSGIGSGRECRGHASVNLAGKSWKIQCILAGDPGSQNFEGYGAPGLSKRRESPFVPLAWWEGFQ